MSGSSGISGISGVSGSSGLSGLSGSTSGLDGLGPGFLTEKVIALLELPALFVAVIVYLKLSPAEFPEGVPEIVNVSALFVPVFRSTEKLLFLSL